jgi:hypothetical protein
MDKRQRNEEILDYLYMWRVKLDNWEQPRLAPAPPLIHPFCHPLLITYRRLLHPLRRTE